MLTLFHINIRRILLILMFISLKLSVAFSTKGDDFSTWLRDTATVNDIQKLTKTKLQVYEEYKVLFMMDIILKRSNLISPPIWYQSFVNKSLKSNESIVVIEALRNLNKYQYYQLSDSIVVLYKTANRFGSQFDLVRNLILNTFDSIGRFPTQRKHILKNIKNVIQVKPRSIFTEHYSTLLKLVDKYNDSLSSNDIKDLIRDFEPNRNSLIDSTNLEQRKSIQLKIQNLERSLQRLNSRNKYEH